MLLLCFLTGPPLVKAFIITLLLLGGAFLAYDRFLTPPESRIVFKEQGSKAAPAAAPAGPIGDVAPLQDTMKPTVPSASKATPAEVVDPTAFKEPHIDSMETLTKNWTFIPRTAFPRPVKLSTDVEVKMSVGSSRLAAGSSVIAIAFENGTLVVTPTEGSTARGQVPLDGTDFKAQIAEGYERWKTWKLDAAKKAWEDRNRATAMASAKAGVDMSNAVAAGGQPVQNADGSYNLLLASIRSGQVNDIRPEKIRKWGKASQEMIEGKVSWLVLVDYESMTIFGPMDTQARATVQGGKVVSWNYTGSGEEVP